MENIKKMIWDLFGNRIEVYEQTVPGKWYEAKYEKTDVIFPNMVYGIRVNGGSIDYDFKSPKGEDSILKSFLNQYISKYETKTMCVTENGMLGKKTKEQIYEKIKNDDRVENWVFYTTLYGIGTFCFFMSAKSLAQVHNKMAEYLKSKNVEFRNEFSDAQWVYRFIVNKDVAIHNKLLTDFKH
jgi:hypothetical protein